MSLFSASSAVSVAFASLTPSQNSMFTKSETSEPLTKSIVAHAAAEKGKIQMYSAEFYQACGIGGWVAHLIIMSTLSQARMFPF